MKNESLQQLLAKYQEGNLSPEELAQLNRLSYKDETIAAAEHQARGIVRRRTFRTVGLAMAGAAVLGAGVWLLRPQGESVLVAERHEAPTAVEQQPVQPVETIADQQLAPVPKAAPRRQAAKPVPAEAVPETVVTPVNEATDDAPVVMCNNQCDADSVISDIWKFLTA